MSGAELPPERQAELAKLQTEGAQLSAKFSQNVLDATDAFGIYFDDAAPLAGIPEDALAMFAAAAQSEGKTGYKIGLQIPHYLAVINTPATANCANKSTAPTLPVPANFQTTANSTTPPTSTARSKTH